METLTAALKKHKTNDELLAKLDIGREVKRRNVPRNTAVVVFSLFYRDRPQLVQLSQVDVSGRTRIPTRCYPARRKRDDIDGLPVLNDSAIGSVCYPGTISSRQKPPSRTRLSAPLRIIKRCNPVSIPTPPASTLTHRINWTADSDNLVPFADVKLLPCLRLCLLVGSRYASRRSERDARHSVSRSHLKFPITNCCA